MFIKPLQNQTCKEGRDKKVRFEAVFSKSGVKAKWFKGKQELFMGKQYHMTSTGDLHVLEISNPAVKDTGKYTCQCLDTTCSAQLDVEDPDPVYKFVKQLPKKIDQYTTKEAVLECTTNSHKAQVKWFKGDKKIDASEKYLIEQDSFGKKILKIQNCKLDDTDDYHCKIVGNTEEKTSTKLTCTEQQFQFMKPLKSVRLNENEQVTLECEVDDWEANVTWFFKGQEITPIPKKIEILKDGRRRKLIIKKAKCTDEGEYMATTNADKTTCEVIVERKFKSKIG